RTSATTRRSGRHAAASGALATRIGGVPSASVSVRTRRSRIRSPPTNSRPFGRPPNRVAPPTANTAPRTDSSAESGAVGMERRVFGDPDPLEDGIAGQAWSYSPEQVLGEGFAGGQRPDKCRVIPVDVLALER